MTNQIPRDFLHIRCWCASTICTELEMHCIWHFSQVDCVSGKCNPDQTWEGFFGVHNGALSVPCSVLQSWEIMPCVLHTLCNVRSSLKSAHCRGYFSLPDVLSWGAEQDLLSDHWAERSSTLLLFVTIAQNSFARTIFTQLYCILSRVKYLHNRSYKTVRIIRQVAFLMHKSISQRLRDLVTTMIVALWSFPLQKASVFWTIGTSVPVFFTYIFGLTSWNEVLMSYDRIVGPNILIIPDELSG